MSAFFDGALDWWRSFKFRREAATTPRVIVRLTTFGPGMSLAQPSCDESA